MASKKHRPEEAVAKLRQVDVLVSQGQSVAEAIRAIGVTEVTYYRWLPTIMNGAPEAGAIPTSTRPATPTSLFIVIDVMAALRSQSSP